MRIKNYQNQNWVQEELCYTPVYTIDISLPFKVYIHSLPDAEKIPLVCQVCDVIPIVCLMLMVDQGLSSIVILKKSWFCCKSLPNFGWNELVHVTSTSYRISRFQFLKMVIQAYFTSRNTLGYTTILTLKSLPLRCQPSELTWKGRGPVG